MNKAFSYDMGSDVVTADPTEAEGFATWQEQERQIALRPQDEEHFEKLFTDQSYLDEIARNPLIVEAEKHSLKPSEIRLGAATRSYLSHRAGRELSGVEYQAARDAYADQYFGKTKVSDTELFGLVQGQYQTQQKRRAATVELYSGAVKQALEDEIQGTSTSTVETFAKWREKNKDLVDAEEELAFFASGRSIVQQAKEDIRAVAPQAARVWQSLTKYEQGEASEQDLQNLGAELAAIPREQRPIVYRYAVIAAQANAGDTGPILQAAMNLEKSVRRGFGWMESPLTLTNIGGALPMTIPTLSYRPLSDIESEARTRMMQLSRDDSTRTDPAKQQEFARMQRAVEMTQVVRELKEVAKTGIDPIKPIFPEGKFLSKGTIERGVYGLAGSLGYMAATAVNPMLGVAAMYGEEYDRMRLDNPDMNPHAAGAAALVSATLQTGIEMLQIRGLRGLPMTGSVLRNLKPGITRVAATVGLGIAEQNAQEAVQDAISAGIPAVMSALRSDMPDKDPAKIFAAYMKQRGEVFFAVLPLGLVGGGFASVRDFAKPGDILNDRSLSYFGFSPDQRRRIVSSRDPDAALRAETPLRTKQSIGDGIAQLKTDLDAARAAQSDQDLPTLESAIRPDGAREWRVIRNPQGEAQQAPQYLSDADLQGKTITLNTLDTKTGQVQQLSMDAAAGQTIVRRNIDSFSKLVDCLLR